MPNDVDNFSGLKALVGGTSISQVIVFIYLPVLSYLYLPEYFGIYALFLATINLINPISTFRYEKSICLSKNNHEQLIIVRICILSLLFIALISSLVSLSLIYLFDIKYPFMWAVLLPIAIFISGLFRVQQQIFLNMENYKSVSITNVSKSIKLLVFQSLFFSLHHFGLILSLIFSNFIFNVKSLRSIFFSQQISWNEIKLTALKYQQFPKWDLLSATFLSLSQQSLILFVGYAFGVTSSGLLLFAQRIITAPTSLIATSFGQMFMSKIIKKKNKLSQQELIKDYFPILLEIATLVLIGVICFSKSIFTLVFDPAWINASYYAQLIIFLVFFRFLATPFSYLFSVYNKQEIGFYFQFSNFIIRVFIFAISFLFKKIEIALIGVSVTGCLVYGGMLIYLSKLVDLRLNLLIFYLYNSILKCSLVMGPLIITNIYLGNIYLYFVIFLSIPLGYLVYKKTINKFIKVNKK